MGTHSNYGFTFFFWLDLVGTASILIDIPWIMLGFGLNNNIFLVVKGGRMGRAARGANSIRFVKLIKMVRMVKLFRIVQLFRKKKGDEGETTPASVQITENELGVKLKPTKMGKFLADRVTQKVILGVLIAFLILPLFDVGSMDYGDKTFIALEHLEFANECDAKMYNRSLDIFEQYHENILHLEIGNRTEINLQNEQLREVEKAEFVSESGASNAVLDMRSKVQEEAILNMCLTSFIMTIFAIGAWFISIDAFILVYPLEYLVVVLRRMTAIAINENEDSNVSGDALFGSVMKSMTDIFYSGKRQTHFIESVEEDGMVEDVAISIIQKSNIIKA